MLSPGQPECANELTVAAQGSGSAVPEPVQAGLSPCPESHWLHRPVDGVQDEVPSSPGSRGVGSTDRLPRELLERRKAMCVENSNKSEIDAHCSALR